MRSAKKIKSGDLLLAEPFALEPYFRRSVVLLCEHNKEEGTLGFILNKSVKMQVAELVNDFPDFKSEVYYGGPVRTDTLHYMHTIGARLKDSVHITNGIFWGGDFEQLKLMLDAGQVKPDDIRFFVGYAGWEVNQLNEEMKKGSWIIENAKRSYVFKENYDNLWAEVLHDKGNVHSVISQVSDFVALN